MTKEQGIESIRVAFDKVRRPVKTMADAEVVVGRRETKRTLAIVDLKMRFITQHFVLFRRLCGRLLICAGLFAAWFLLTDILNKIETLLILAAAATIAAGVHTVILGKRRTLLILAITATLVASLVLLSAVTIGPREYRLYPNGSKYGKAIEEIESFTEQGRFTVSGWGGNDARGLQIEIGGTRSVATYEALLHYDADGNFGFKEISFELTDLGKALLVLLLLMLAGLVLDLRCRPAPGLRTELGMKARFAMLFVLASYARVLLSFSFDWPAIARLEHACVYPFLWAPVSVWVRVVAVFIATTVGSLVTGYLLAVALTRSARIAGMRSSRSTVLAIACGFLIGWLPDGLSAARAGVHAAKIQTSAWEPRSEMLARFSENRGYPDRPAFLVIPRKGRHHGDSVSFSKSLWHAIYPTATQTNGRGSISVGPLSVRYGVGTSDKCIAGNLDRLVQAFGRGAWWRRLPNGYLICFDERESPDTDFTDTSRLIPAFTLFSPSALRASALLEDLLGVRIAVSGTREPLGVESMDPFSERNREADVLYFSTSEPTRGRDIILKLASFYGYGAVETPLGVTLAYPSPADMTRVADSMMDELRRSYQYHDPRLCSIPKEALSEMSKYLNDSDENLVQTILDAMLSRSVPADASRLIALLDSERDDGDHTRRMAAYLLARMGDERALSYIASFVPSDSYSLRRMVLAAGWVRTRRGAETQRNLLRRYQPPFPAYRACRQTVVSLPPGMDVKEACELLRMSMDYANIHCRYYARFRAEKVLMISTDGKSAWWGLGGYRPMDLVRLQKHADSWLIVSGHE